MSPITGDPDSVQWHSVAACCACLTELVLNDTNAHQVAQANGIYLLMLLIPPSSDTRGLTERQTKALHTLQVITPDECDENTF